jgi:hypothetical protein
VDNKLNESKYLMMVAHLEKVIIPIIAQKKLPIDLDSFLMKRKPII